jgi:hypothetical protein
MPLSIPCALLLFVIVLCLENALRLHLRRQRINANLRRTLDESS